MNYAIFDIDNCLADDAWRIEFIDWSKTDADERYWPYHARCLGDSPRNAQFVLREHLRGSALVFFTARPEPVRELTKAWLRTNTFFAASLPWNAPMTLLMRQPGEFTPSVQLKAQMLARFRTELNAQDRIVAAYDDRADIVAMYRAEGINAHVLKIHDVCAYTNPATGEMPHGC